MESPADGDDERDIVQIQRNITIPLTANSKTVPLACQCLPKVSEHNLYRQRCTVMHACTDHPLSHYHVNFA